MSRSSQRVLHTSRLEVPLEVGGVSGLVPAWTDLLAGTELCAPRLKFCQVVEGPRFRLLNGQRGSHSHSSANTTWLPDGLKPTTRFLRQKPQLQASLVAASQSGFHSGNIRAASWADDGHLLKPQFL